MYPVYNHVLQPLPSLTTGIVYYHAVQFCTSLHHSLVLDKCFECQTHQCNHQDSPEGSSYGIVDKLRITKITS